MSDAFQTDIFADDEFNNSSTVSELLAIWLEIAVAAAKAMVKDVFRWSDLRCQLPLVPEDAEGNVMRVLGKELKQHGFEKIPMAKRSPFKSRQSGADFFWLKPKCLCICKNRQELQHHFEDLFHCVLNSIFEKWDTKE